MCYLDMFMDVLPNYIILNAASPILAHYAALDSRFMCHAIYQSISYAFPYSVWWDALLVENFKKTLDSFLYIIDDQM